MGYLLWTWNPRYYAGAIKTKVVYDAYANSQDEVEAIAAAKVPIRVRILYDP